MPTPKKKPTGLRPKVVCADRDQTFLGRRDQFLPKVLSEFDPVDCASVDTLVERGHLRGMTLGFCPIDLGEADLERVLAEAKMHGVANRCIITFFDGRDKQRAEQWAIRFGSIALHKNMGSAEPNAEGFFKAAGEHLYQVNLAGGDGCHI